MECLVCTALKDTRDGMAATAGQELPETRALKARQVEMGQADPREPQGTLDLVD